jgi:hypothetical protein
LVLPQKIQLAIIPACLLVKFDVAFSGLISPTPLQGYTFMQNRKAGTRRLYTISCML